MPDDQDRKDFAHGVPTISVSQGSTLANRTGSWKCIQPVYQDRIAPCNAACPVGIDIEGVMNLMRLDRVEDARELLLRENPMPSVCGRVCDHACQRACSRALFDEAVNIHAVERMLGDRTAQPRMSAPPRTRTEHVAVVGSGPAGLACAYHLVRLGYSVTVFEADPEPGGWLRYGVPEYRLPRAVLVREIEFIRAEGVAIQCGVRIGGNLPWKDLERFDAVFLASGARAREGFEWQEQGLLDVRPGVDYLHEVRAGGRGHAGRRVIVVGGSDMAVDCARTALRLGSEPTVLFTAAREEMAADPDTVEEALREGVRFEFFTRVVGLQVSEHPEDEQAIDAIRNMFDSGESAAPGARLVGVACVRLQPEQQAADGSRRTLSVPGSSFVLPADTLLTAPGGEGEEGALPPDLHRRGYILKTDEFGHTSREGFFAGGDLAAEPRTVAHALGSGKRAAIGIDRWLRTRAGDAVPAIEPQALRYGGTGAMSVTRWRGDDPVHRTNELNEVVKFEQLNMAYFQHVASTPDHHRAPGQSGADFGEANLGLAPDEALAEAKRCFNCGVCNDCELCLIYCPDVAIKRHSSGHGFSLSYKYCKGCGLCVEECPRGAMIMTREGL